MHLIVSNWQVFNRWIKIQNNNVQITHVLGLDRTFLFSHLQSTGEFGVNQAFSGSYPCKSKIFITMMTKQI